MKKLSILLIISAFATGCASTYKKVEHAEHGAMTVKDKRHVEDTEFCAAAYLDTQASTAEEKAEAKAMYQKRTFMFKTLVAGIVLNHAAETGEESALHVDACMTEKGWVTW